LSIPYPGLRPFDEADHLLFFGRNEQANELLMRLEDSAFVAVVGSSGSGKSSLVRAGLLPLLRDGFLFGTDDWKIAVVRPGHEPYQQLARKLSEFRADVPQADVLALLRHSDDGLLEAVHRLCGDQETHVLVVIDQFEELFGFRRARDSARSLQNCASRDEASAFVAMLLAAARKARQQLRVLLTMRSDFVGDCEVFLGLPQAVSQSQFLVPRLTRSQMEAAIIGPSQIRQAEYAPFEFQPGLVNMLINDAGDRPDQLPLLQHALMRTWKASDCNLLTEANYTAAGRIEKSLSNDADDAFQQLAPDEKRLVRHLFLLLCDVSPEGQITRRRPLAQEVMDVARVDCPQIERVIRVFQAEDRNFLLPPGPESIVPSTVLDISHESLLRQWLQLKDWLNDERESAAEYMQLAIVARRHADGRADLLSKRDLETANQWFDQAQPTAAWGDRYAAGQVEKVSAFLTASRKAETARLQQEQAEREKIEHLKESARLSEEMWLKDQALAAGALANEQRAKAESTRRLLRRMTVVAGVAVAACVVAIFYQTQARQAQGKAEFARNDAIKAQRDAEDEKKKAEFNEQLAEAAKAEAINAQRNAIEERKKAKTNEGLVIVANREIEEKQRELRRQIELLGIAEALRELVQSNEKLWCIANEGIQPLHSPRVPPSIDSSMQTFAGFLQIPPQPRPFNPDLSIEIQPIGPSTQPQVIEAVQDFLSRFYGRSAKILPAKTDLHLQPSDMRDHDYKNGRVSHQWRAEAVIKAARLQKPPHETILVVITENDLWSEGLNFVFGVTDTSSRAAIVSLDGLTKPGLSPDEAKVLLLRRTLKIAVFVTSQIAGIRDFAGYECGMNLSNNTTELDKQPLFFCPECERKVWWLSNCDPLKRYELLREFASLHELKPEAAHWHEAQSAIRSNINKLPKIRR
jgi:predicted Zn-dependent protease